MICIFSGIKDHTTTRVIKWINHLSNIEVLRINYDETEPSSNVLLEVKNGQVFIKIDNKNVELNEIKAVWYRKGKSWFFINNHSIKISGHSNFSSYLNKKVNDEYSKLSEYLHYLIKRGIPCIGSAIENDLNKLVVLEVAREVGLLVPEFYISNNRDYINNYINYNYSLITKAMSDGIYFFDNKDTENGYFSYTEDVEMKDINYCSQTIIPSFLQKKIFKKIDLRVFFLIDRCFSIAILSQSDDKTAVDFRRYNNEKPNRNIPYNLPQEIEKKIKKLFDKLDLNTGSVDLIVDQYNNYYFLEVNPVGQFSNFSMSCNYNLEKELAKALINYASR